jgi:hypothetical protein
MIWNRDKFHVPKGDISMIPEHYRLRYAGLDRLSKITQCIKQNSQQPPPPPRHLNMGSRVWETLRIAAMSIHYCTRYLVTGVRSKTAAIVQVH